jgi:enoyl-CoA hydratase/carnithine racemase
MGGGYGIAGNGKNIVVDDTTRFAMPETAIGFFPDVGIAWKLARAGALGMYIALTGDIFDADMMMASGMATEKKGETRDILYKAEIKKHFSHNTLEDVFKSLENDRSDFAIATLELLKTRSLLSLHVTFHHVKKAYNEDFDTVIERDYHLACAFFAGREVYEGIRAQLVDRDKSPKWEHESIHDVPQEVIDYYLNFRNNS